MIILKELEVDDYLSWYQGFNNRLDKQLPYDEGKLDMEPCTKSWFVKLVEHHQTLRKCDEQYIYGIFRKEDGKHLGMIYLAKLVRDRTSWAEIGYFIHNQYFQKGYGKAALKSLLKINREELHFHRLEAQTFPDNEPSKRLLVSCGFVFEGRRQQMRYENGEWQPQYIYVYLEDVDLNVE